MACRPPRSLLAAHTQADELAPGRNHGDPDSDGICGDPAHAARRSDHNPDPRGIPHAVDVDDDPDKGFDVHAHAEQVRLRVKNRTDDIWRVVTLIISNRRYASRNTNWEWRPYDGINAHASHAHFSIAYTTFAENWTGSWWAGEEIDMAAADDIIKRIGEFEQDTRKLVTGLIEKEVEEQAQKTRRVVLDLVEAIAKVQGVPPEKVRANLRPETRKILDKVD